MRPFLLTLVMLALGALCAPSAWADRGGLSAEVGGGITSQRVTPPYSSTTTWGVAGSVHLQGRYALTHWLEVGALGFLEVPNTYTHHGTIAVDGATYPGALQHDYYRFGALGVARLIFGLSWRPFVQLEVGWSHAEFNALKAFDTRNPNAPQQYQLPGLKAVARDGLALGVSGGLQKTWNKLFVSAGARADYVVGGSSPAIAVSAHLAAGWTFYP